MTFTDQERVHAAGEDGQVLLWDAHSAARKRGCQLPGAITSATFAPDSRHLFPAHWDAIDPAPQTHPVSAVQGLGVWTGIGHFAEGAQSVDHVDLRPGFTTSSPSVFPDH